MERRTFLQLMTALVSIWPALDVEAKSEPEPQIIEKPIEEVKALYKRGTIIIGDLTLDINDGTLEMQREPIVSYHDNGWRSYEDYEFVATSMTLTTCLPLTDFQVETLLSIHRSPSVYLEFEKINGNPFSWYNSNVTGVRILNDMNIQIFCDGPGVLDQ